MTAHATHTRVHPRHADVLWGAVSPTSSGEHVSIQQRYGDAWRTVGHVTLKWQLLPNRTHGVGYTWTFNEQWNGTYRFRVLIEVEGPAMIVAPGTSSRCRLLDVWVVQGESDVAIGAASP